MGLKIKHMVNNPFRKCGRDFFMFKCLLAVMLVVTFTIVIPPKSSLMFQGINGKYVFYTKTSVSSDFVYADTATALSVKKGLKVICGEGIEFSYDKNTVNQIVKKYKAKRVIVERGKEFYTEYYYSKSIPFYELIGRFKVNLQIAYKTDTCMVASPVIYGGY